MLGVEVCYPFDYIWSNLHVIRAYHVFIAKEMHDTCLFCKVIILSTSHYKNSCKSLISHFWFENWGNYSSNTVWLKGFNCSCTGPGIQTTIFSELCRAYFCGSADFIGKSRFELISRAYRPKLQRGRGYVAVMLSCVSSKFKSDSCSVSYSNSCPALWVLRICTIFSLDMNFARYLLHALLSFKPLLICMIFITL
jgi:predicted nucleic acid binding AN1-type Zn finger protein